MIIFCVFHDIWDMYAPKWSHGFLSMFFGFLGKFWIGIEKTPYENIVFKIKKGLIQRKIYPKINLKKKFFLWKNHRQNRKKTKFQNLQNDFQLVRCFLFYFCPPNFFVNTFWSWKNIFVWGLLYINPKFPQESKKRT